MSAVIGALRVTLGIDTAAFEKGVASAQQRLGSIGKDMRAMGRSLSTYVTAPIAGFGALTLKTAGDFQMAMNQVRAVSGATGESFEALREQAKQLGATTQFTASEAADAMNFLAMAGMKTEEILSAMPETLQLAAAAQLDMASAADIVTNILAGYNKDVEELSHATDVLVKSFTSANTDLNQLAQAMKYAGPVANAAGVQFEETAAALSLMGNAGIQGSMAGTSLRGAISRVLNPTKAMASAMAEAGLSFTDTSGRLLPLADIIEQLEPHANNAGLFMELFGQRAGPSMAALVTQGADAIRGLAGELENSAGTAAEVSAVQMEGFNGAMRQLAAAFEALQIAIADSGLLDWAAEATEAVASWIQSMSETSPEILKWGAIVAGLAAAIGPVLIALGLLATGVAAISAPVALTVAGIAALTAAAVALAPAFYEAGQKARAFVVETVESLRQWAADTMTSIGETTAWISEHFTLFRDQVVEIWTEMVDLIKGVWDAGMSWITEKASAATEGIRGAWQWLSDTLVGNSVIPDMVDMIGDEFDRMGRIAGTSTEGAVRNVAAAWGRGADQVQNEMGGMVSGVMSSLGRLFQGSKAFAVAQAIINTFQGITEALKLPFPASLAAAAKVSAQGFAAVAGIRRTTPTSSSGGASTAGAGTGFGMAAAEPIAPQAPQQVEASRSVHISLQGQNYSRDQLREFVDSLNDYIRDGARLVVNP